MDRIKKKFPLKRGYKLVGIRGRFLAKDWMNGGMDTRWEVVDDGIFVKNLRGYIMSEDCERKTLSQKRREEWDKEMKELPDVKWKRVDPEGDCIRLEKENKRLRQLLVDTMLELEEHKENYEH